MPWASGGWQMGVVMCVAGVKNVDGGAKAGSG